MILTLAIVGSLIFLVLAFSLAASVKSAREERRGWRLRFTAGDVRYEEKNAGEVWSGILIETIQRGHGIHGFRLKSAADWQSYPTWAANRREEIVARVKEECPSLHFYEGEEPISEGSSQPPGPTPEVKPSPII